MTDDIPGVPDLDEIDRDGLSETQLAALESVEAHQDATGHERADIVTVGRSPTVISLSCHECGQHLAVMEMGP